VRNVNCDNGQNCQRRSKSAPNYLYCVIFREHADVALCKWHVDIVNMRFSDIQVNMSPTMQRITPKKKGQIVENQASHVNKKSARNTETELHEATVTCKCE
jgi:3-isopropylmalate dehydratase small subunit